MKTEQRFYSSVNGVTTATQDYVVPEGDFLIMEVGGDAPMTGSTMNVQITWDPAGANEIIFVTYTSSVQTLSKLVTSDGTQKIRISLVNGGVSSRVMGAYFKGL